MKTLFIRKENIPAWFSALRAAHDRILAPVRKSERVVEFAPVDTLDQVATDYVQTTRSAKEALFPRTEVLFSYRKEGREVEVEDFAPSGVPNTLLWQVRPCDAASVFPLDAVFNWDYRDKLYNTRRERTAIVAVSCAKADGACFCTAVGGAPGSTAGSDILLTYTPEGAIAEVSTEKGERLVALSQALFEPSDGKDKEKYLAPLPAAFDREQLRARLEGMFDSPVWKQQSERCLGCGACAYVCPTCSCFDIQDRSAGQTGQRLRCWDSCGFALFTQHTSGHNPRPTQATRWRQRLLHKFSYMPQRLKALGCTGCGRCSRACPVDMNLKDHLVSIADTK